MYEKILVPLDGSERAEAILPYVENLAHCYSSTVIFMQVVEPQILYATPYDAYPELNYEEANRRAAEIDAYLAGLEEQFQAKGIATERQVKHGPVVQAILGLARSEKIGLVAMASHGRTGLARVFYGSVASGILNQIDRPLLLVRSD